MKELTSLCSGIGFSNARTYINSGNVLFESDLSETELRIRLEEALQEKTAKDIPVVIRSVQELRSILSSNPFPETEPSTVGVMLFSGPVERTFTHGITGLDTEEIVSPGRKYTSIIPAEWTA